MTRSGDLAHTIKSYFVILSATLHDQSLFMT